MKKLILFVFTVFLLSSCTDEKAAREALLDAGYHPISVGGYALAFLKEKPFVYSKESFDGYKYRSVISFEPDMNEDTYNLDIFTTNPDKDEVFELFKTSILKKYPNAFDIKMRIWTTKEQDDLNGQIIDEFLND